MFIVGQRVTMPTATGFMFGTVEHADAFGISVAWDVYMEARLTLHEPADLEAA